VSVIIADVTFEFTVQHESCYMVTGMDINLKFIIRLVEVVEKVLEEYVIVAVKHVACLCIY